MPGVLSWCYQSLLTRAVRCEMRLCVCERMAAELNEIVCMH